MKKMADEKKKKEKSAKAAKKETAHKASERDKKMQEKKTKATEKKVKEKNAKKKKKKADCAAKQEEEQMRVRFTLAQDKKVSLGHGWQNFGNGYEGIRLQKLGNICTLSGLIRVADAKIQTGTDKGKKFWHAMETLIQTGESVMAPKKGEW